MLSEGFPFAPESRVFSEYLRPRGRGKLMAWSAAFARYPRSIGHADPMEFSEGYTSMAALYSYALKTAGVKAAFEALHPLSPRVLGFPTILSDAVLYSFSSESLQNQ